MTLATVRLNGAFGTGEFIVAGLVNFPNSVVS